jgi:hypothetical protein
VEPSRSPSQLSRPGWYTSRVDACAPLTPGYRPRAEPRRRCERRQRALAAPSVEHGEAARHPAPDTQRGVELDHAGFYRTTTREQFAPRLHELLDKMDISERDAALLKDMFARLRR